MYRTCKLDGASSQKLDRHRIHVNICMTYIENQLFEEEKMLKTFLLALAVTLALTTSAAWAGDRIERQVENDPDYRANVDKAIKMLEARGYRVHDVDADDYLGKPALDVDAEKIGREYDIKLSYPDLKILREKRDR